MRWSTKFLRLHEKDLPPGGRFLVIGDIHGEYDLLQRLLTLCAYTADQDHVICLGDLIDRGPKSFETLQWFIEHPRRSSLLGNHEAMMMASSLDHDARRIWNLNGGDWIDPLPPPIVELLFNLLPALPLAAELHLNDGRHIGLVHAEVPPATQWKVARNAVAKSADLLDDTASRVASSLIWGRRRFKFAERLYRADPVARHQLDTPRGQQLLRTEGIDLVIAGHSILMPPVPGALGNHWFIDTGAYWGGPGFTRWGDGRLTVVDPASKQYWQVGRKADEAWGPLPFPDSFLSEKEPS